MEGKLWYIVLSKQFFGFFFCHLPERLPNLDFLDVQQMGQNLEKKKKKKK